MPRKKLDSRIRTLIENGVRERHRTLFVIVGDRAREQVVNLHYMLSRAQVRARPNVLWCYKKNLGFNSTAVALRAADPRRKSKRQWSSAGSGATASAAFNEFIATTEIRYVYYSDTHRVLGQTYGMLVLQDFEALTPNLLARTVETVAGGGIVCLLLRTMDSLRQLHALAMDAHKRFRPSGANSAEPVARFNERFLLSLATCDSCLVVDDELDVLPISSRVRAALESSDAAGHARRTALPYDDINDDDDDDSDDDSNNKDGTSKEGSTSGSTRRGEARVVVVEESRELRELKESLHDVVPAGPLIRLATTVDQARAALLFLDTITEKSLRTTVSLTAARGRGKSAALGIAIAGAVATGYSNIFVTAPSPENLKTLFDFVLRGFDALGYREHADYDIIQATNPELGKCIVRLNIYRAHRQTVQYIAPADANKLGQAELLVIDEAAAIPLPLVQALLGPYLVFLSSTVNGYEGTGRSLSLKLVQKLREQSRGADNNNNSNSNTSTGAGGKGTGAGAGAPQASGRVLRELVLEEPIRYAAGDPVEKWLNALLCLDAANAKALPPLTGGFPHPSECQLFYVSRDTLFSFHKQSEEFLQRIMALFVSSHYKNSPNDLQLMSDAPAHHIFVLLGPVRDTTKIPDVLAAVHVSLEGAISREAVMLTTGRGQKAAGDLIPWTVSQQFQDNDFPALSGARVVRIATHPAMQGMGYGSRALQLLGQYYQGEITSLDEDFVEEPTAIAADDDDGADNAADMKDDKTAENGSSEGHSSSRLLTEKIEPRKGLPPLLVPLQQRRPERLHWLGVAFGISTGLYNFWSANGYRPVYVRLTPNEITGEHSCIMMARIDTPVNARADTDEFRSVLSTDRHWLDHFVADFRKRFAALLEYDFAAMPVALPTSVLVPDVVAASKDPGLCTKARDDAAAAEHGSDAGEPGAKRARVELATADDYDRLGVPLARREIHQYFTPYDLKRLDSYAANLVDYHVVLDLVPLVARLVFTGRVPVGFSAHQYSTLVGVGLQHKRVEAVARDLGIEVNQLLANFNKAVRKVTAWLRQAAEKEVESELSLADTAAAAAAAAASSAPVAAGADPRLAQTTLDEDLDAAAKASLRKLAGAGKRSAGPTVLDPQTGATSAEAAAKMEGADAQDDDLLAGGEDGETEAQKQERLARRLGVSWYKINNGDVLDQAISKLNTAIPNFVSFKVRQKDVTKKTKKNQAVFERGGKHKKHARGGRR